MQPGLRLLFWPFHATHTVDLREEVLDIPRQTNITKDNAPIDIDFLVYMRIMEQQAERAVLEVVDYYGAVVGIATTTLRAVIGEMNVDDVLSQRERINEELRIKLDEITERWGIKGNAGRNPRDRAGAGHPGSDEPADVRRADTARGGDRGGRHAAGGGHSGRGRKVGGHTQGRGTPPVRDPHRRGRPARPPY